MARIHEDGNCRFDRKVLGATSGDQQRRYRRDPCDEGQADALVVDQIGLEGDLDRVGAQAVRPERVPLPPRIW